MTPPAARFLLLCLALGLMLGLWAPAAHAQTDASEWTTYTSLRQVEAVDASGEAIWAVTTGGVFRYEPATGSLSTFTAGQGLHNARAQAVAFDGRRQVLWIGYQDGVFDRLDVDSGTVRAFRDIARTQRFGSTEINRLVVHGDSLLVATAFGLVVFDPERQEVRDTYSRLGALDAGTPVHDVAVGPDASGRRAFWLATQEGVAWAPVDGVNLQDPASWTIDTQGLPSVEVRTLAWFEAQLYVGTTGGVAVRQPGGGFAALAGAPEQVSQLRVVGDRLIGTEPFMLLVVAPGGGVRRMGMDGYDAPTTVVAGPQGGVWIGDRQGGLLSVAIAPPPATRVTVQQGDLFPNGPYHGSFSDLFVTKEGTLWAGGELASAEVPGTGFYRLGADGTWTNYTERFVPELAGRTSFKRIYVDPLGNAWAGSEGAGLAQVTPDGDVTVYDAANSSLRPVPQFPVIFVGGLAAERDGTLWVTSRGSSVPLHRRTPDGTWTGINTISCGSFSTAFGSPDALLIDAFGQKWALVVSRTNFRQTLGLLVLDVGAATDPSDDRCRYFSEQGSGGVGLPSTDLTALAEDRDGNIWIGTEKGLAFVLNSGIVARDPAAQPIWPQLANISQNARYLLQGVPVRDIAVDPANRLWVASDDGVRLVGRSEGGFEVLRMFSADNSPLLSNAVQAIAVDPTTGRVFFATAQGLISYDGDAVAAEETVQTLRIYPNPVRMPAGAAGQVTIEGLVEATDLRILAPHGEVVARLTTRGGRARWDGRDLSGADVPSGVYLVVAVGQNGEGTAYGKVAVIR